MILFLLSWLQNLSLWQAQIFNPRLQTWVWISKLDPFNRGLVGYCKERLPEHFWLQLTMQLLSNLLSERHSLKRFIAKLWTVKLWGTIPFKKIGNLVIYEVKWVQFKVKYSTLKVLGGCWVFVSTITWFIPFRRGITRLLMSIFIKVKDHQS